MQGRGSGRRPLILGVLGRFVDVLGLFTAMYVSDLLVRNSLFGGAVYLTGVVWVLYARIYSQQNLSQLPRHIRVRGLMIFVLSSVLTAALVLLFPYIQSDLTSLVLVLLIVGFLAQQVVTDLISRRLRPARPRRRGALLALCHLLFLAGYGVLFVLNQRTLGYPVPSDMPAAYVAVVMISFLAFGCQLAVTPTESLSQPAQGAADPGEDAMLGVRAYRLYNRMTINALFAINLSITAFICYMRFLPYTGFLSSALMLCVWLALIGGITALGFWALKQRFLPQYDRYVIFAMGLVLWALAALGVLSSGGQGGVLSTLLNGGLMGMSVACMLSIIMAQSYDMQAVVELELGEVDRRAYARNTAVMVDWSMLTSYLLLLVMLCVATFIADGQFDKMETIQGLQAWLRVIMLALPMVFVLVALVYSLLQPLDTHYIKKLDKFRSQQALGQDNLPLEARLRKVLVAKGPRRMAFIVIRFLLRPFFPCKVVGKNLVDTSEGPAIFLCNHLEIYGPIISVLHSPFPIRPWVIFNMLDEESICQHMQPGAQKVLGFLPEGFRQKVVRRVAPLLMWILGSADPVPVYRGSLRGFAKTIEASVDALAYDDNLLIFPESDYQDEGIGPLSAGFVQLGKSYHRRTGKCVTFYPLYINKKAKRMSFGQGFAFNPDNNSGDERDRLMDYLREAMDALAQGKVPQAIPPGEDERWGGGLAL